jgi:DNA-binding HxlR family transcriptional regulator
MDVQKAYEEELAGDLNALSQILAVLMRHGLVDKSVSEAAIFVNGEGEPARKTYRLTTLALMLVEACTNPKG